MICDFDEHLICRRCGYRANKRVRRACEQAASPELPATIETQINCPHRGEVLQTINGRTAGCGCPSSAVDVYECRRFREPVLKQAAARCMDTIREAVPTYTGRTCRDCAVSAVPKQTTKQQPPSTATVRSLAAVAAHFNPQHSVRRRANWAECRENLHRHGIELITVEGVRQGDTQDLDAGPQVQHVVCRDVLWHKERLLNIAIDRLPDHVDAVAWIDADILWDDDEIGGKILDALCRWPVVQPWSTCVMLGADGQPEPWFNGQHVIRATGYHNQGGKTRDGHPNNSHPGFAWAARRETLSAVGGLYDRNVTGAGDTAMVLGFFGDFKSRFLLDDRMSPGMMAHWRAWADRAYSVVGGQIGYVDCAIRHLYHGSIMDRGYAGRWKALATNGFDPRSHIEHTADGPLQWTPEAPSGLREWVADFLLRQRKEDGR